MSRSRAGSRGTTARLTYSAPAPTSALRTNTGGTRGEPYWSCHSVACSVAPQVEEDVLRDPPHERRQPLEGRLELAAVGEVVHR